MLRALRTAVSGLRSHQFRMDVIGNNIANINTAAFKRGRAAFNEVLGQRLYGAGINPSSVGLGVSVGSIDQTWEQGTIQYTGSGTDLALSGDGFFIVRGGDGNVLTRDGTFITNRSGELVTPHGMALQGWVFNPDGTLNQGALRNIRIDPNATDPARRTENIYAGGNLSADAAVGDTNTISTVAYDGQGTAHTLMIVFEKTQDLEGAGYDEWTISLQDPEGRTITLPGTPTLAFGSDGTIDAANSGLTANADGDHVLAFDWDIYGTGTTETMTLNFGGGTSQAITQYGGSTTAAVREQDGYAAGALIGFNITQEGILELNFSNGQQQQAYQLALGDVNNPNGLEQIGDNLYALNRAAGDLRLGRAGQEFTTMVTAGALEQSNVDLATEFTDMIVAQRGYQASARVITTSDELLQETVSLKR